MIAVAVIALVIVWHLWESLKECAAEWPSTTRREGSGSRRAPYLLAWFLVAGFIAWMCGC